jgi:hypothetical protein
VSAPRKGRRAAQDAAFTFTGEASDREVREAAFFAGEVYQPTLLTLLSTLGRDDVQRRLIELGALTRTGGISR